jgi:hypothetical protein
MRRVGCDNPLCPITEFSSDRNASDGALDTQEPAYDSPPLYLGGRFELFERIVKSKAVEHPEVSVCGTQRESMLNRQSRQVSVGNKPASWRLT